MKKLLIGGLVAASLVIVPQTASASVFTDLFNAVFGGGTTTVTDSKPLTCGSLGDVNGDGKITQVDVNLLSVLTDGSPTSNAQFEAADVNKDGKIDELDVLFLKNYLEGKIESLPGCSEDTNTQFPPTSALVCGTLGDINNDGKITQVDVNLLNALAEGTSGSKAQADAADVNKDGNIDEVDVLFLKNYLLGKIKSLPGCSEETNAQLNRQSISTKSSQNTAQSNPGNSSITVLSPKVGDEIIAGHKGNWTSWISTNFPDNGILKVDLFSNDRFIQTLTDNNCKIYPANLDSTYMVDRCIKITQWSSGKQSTNYDIAYPSNIRPGQYKLKFSCVTPTYKSCNSDPKQNEVFSGTFSIVGPSGPAKDSFVTLLTPNGGEKLVKGSKYTIKWATNQPSTKTVRISLNSRTNSGEWIDFNAPNTGSYDWVVSDLVHQSPTFPGYVIKIDGNGDTASAFDESDSPFEILTTSITVRSPKAGETIKYGTSFNVNYSVNYDSDSLKVSLYNESTGLVYTSPTFKGRADDVLNYVSIATGSILSKQLPSGKYYVKICDDSKSLCNQSVTFSIVNQATTTVSDSTCYTFAKYLQVGDEGADVVALQKFLINNGFLSLPAGTNPGYFGDVTLVAVKSYQKSVGIISEYGTYSVGPYTIAKLNASCNGSLAPVVTSITVTSPRSGSYKVGDVLNIELRGSSNTGYVETYLSGGGNQEGYAKSIGQIKMADSATQTIRKSYIITSADVSKSGFTWKVLVCPTGESTNSKLCALSGEFTVVAATPTSSVAPAGTATPSITLIGPIGGERFNVGDTMSINWIAKNTPAGYVAFIGLAGTNGIYVDSPTQGYCNLKGGCIPLTYQHMVYTIPSNIPSGYYKIKIYCWKQNSESSDCSASDMSQNYFTISSVTASPSPTTVPYTSPTPYVSPVTPPYDPPATYSSPTPTPVTYPSSSPAPVTYPSSSPSSYSSPSSSPSSISESGSSHRSLAASALYSFGDWIDAIFGN